MLPIYTRVQVTSARYLDQGVKLGMLGYIIEVYPDGYEVEISDPSGNTIALCAVRASDVVVAEIDPVIIGD